jgi:hypothetical protein
VRIKSLPRQKSRPLELWMVAPNPETARLVSASDPYCLNRRSCRSRWLSAPEEGIVDIGEREDEPSEATRGTCQSRHDVSFLFTHASCEEERLEGHRSWGSWNCLRRRGRSVGSIYSSQSRPGHHLCHIQESRSLFTILHSKRCSDEPPYRKQPQSGKRSNTSTHVWMHWGKISQCLRVTWQSIAAEMAYCGMLLFSLFDSVLIPFQQTQGH